MMADGSTLTKEVIMPSFLRPLTSTPRAVPLLLGLCLSATARSQHPVLAPTSDTTITVSSSVLHYSSIDIPTGVTVRFVVPGYGPVSPGMPAILLCDGDAIVHGSLSVSGSANNAYPAGWVTTGEGALGIVCDTGVNASFSPPQGGFHAGTYGSVIPFSLEGGSFGGLLVRYPWCLGGTPTIIWGGHQVARWYCSRRGTSRLMV